MLADANGPVVTEAPIGATGYGTTATPSSYVYSGVLPQQDKGFNWWLVFGALVLIVLLAAIVKYFWK
jgi:hypothetical protein